ncbi:MAG: hypothetical protein ACI906_003911 [Candidatus Latescibacterota bacterium]|jgi:hypothetical protein
MNDDKLRDALPFLRPRIEEPSAIILLFFGLLCTGLMTLVVLHLMRSLKERKKRHLKLREAGAGKGLNSREIALLERLGSKSSNPVQLVESLYAFDRTIAPYLEDLLERDWNHKQIRQIAHIRQQLGFDQVPAEQALRSTRQLEEGLTLMVWCEAQEIENFYPWVLVRREERALVLAPLLQEDFARYGTLAHDQPLAVRFWRSADTEYRFESAIYSADPSTNTIVLHHSDTIERLQQRDFHRIYTHFAIRFFLVKESALALEGKTPEEGAETKSLPAAAATSNTIRSGRRIEATVLDLSAGGLSIETQATGPIEGILIVDPDFEEPFPLAELSCQIVHQTRVGSANRLQLRFDSMPAAREAELVRCVYEHQLRQA